jgi:hypothetical protein
VPVSFCSLVKTIVMFRAIMTPNPTLIPAIMIMTGTPTKFLVILIRSIRGDMDMGAYPGVRE